MNLNDLILTCTGAILLAIALTASALQSDRDAAAGKHFLTLTIIITAAAALIAGGTVPYLIQLFR